MWKVGKILFLSLEQQQSLLKMRWDFCVLDGVRIGQWRETRQLFFLLFSKKKEREDEENDDVHAYVLIFVCVSRPRLKIGRRSQQIPTGKNGGRTGTGSEKPSSTFFRKDCGVFRLWGQGPPQKKPCVRGEKHLRFLSVAPTEGAGEGTK